MRQTRGAVQTVPGAAPDIAALILPVPALADVAVVVPAGYHAARPAGGADLAACAASARRADARVARYAVYAGGTACARVAGAFVHVYATIRAGEAWRALAPEPVDPVHALAAVQAWQRLAVVHVAATVGPLEALPAYASVVPVGGVHAGRPVLAGVARARRRGYVDRPRPPIRADSGK